MAAFNIVVCSIGLFVLALAALVLDAHRTAAKHRHLPWFGADKATWYNLMTARVTNTFNLKGNYQSLIETVSQV